MTPPQSDSKAAVQSYFDQDVRGYLRAYSRTGQARGEIFRERRGLVLSLLQEPVGRVLDVGSGPGVFTKALLERGGDCWVVDLSPQMILVSRDQWVGSPEARRVHYGIADIESLPFDDGAFDTALCIGVLQYLAAPEVALRELSRVTRPGGQVVISFPNRRSPLNLFHQFVLLAMRTLWRGLRRVGIKRRPDESRLTFRQDIPNRSFLLDQIEVPSRQVGLRLDRRITHSLHFPFRIPGLAGPLRMWDRLAHRFSRAGWFETWGREVIVRFVRDR